MAEQECATGDPDGAVELQQGVGPEGVGQRAQARHQCKFQQDQCVGHESKRDGKFEEPSARLGERIGQHGGMQRQQHDRAAQRGVPQRGYRAGHRSFRFVDLAMMPSSCPRSSDLDQPGMSRRRLAGCALHSSVLPCRCPLIGLRGPPVRNPGPTAEFAACALARWLPRVPPSTQRGWLHRCDRYSCAACCWF